jgi:hypothetical protein
MTITSFEDLCIGFCELARLRPPALAADPAGVTAFHLDSQGVGVDVIYAPDKADSLAFVVIGLGPVENQPRAAADILMELMQANFLSLRPHPPTFACDPATGEAVLQCTFPIRDGRAVDLAAVIDEGIRLARRWRRDCSLGGRDAP